MIYCDAGIVNPNSRTHTVQCSSRKQEEKKHARSPAHTPAPAVAYRPNSIYALHLRRSVCVDRRTTCHPYAICAVRRRRFGSAEICKWACVRPRRRRQQQPRNGVPVCVVAAAASACWCDQSYMGTWVCALIFRLPTSWRFTMNSPHHVVRELHFQIQKLFNLLQSNLNLMQIILTISTIFTFSKIFESFVNSSEPFKCYVVSRLLLLLNGLT